jgi:hypothetical protein
MHLRDFSGTAIFDTDRPIAGTRQSSNLKLLVTAKDRTALHRHQKIAATRTLITDGHDQKFDPWKPSLAQSGPSTGDFCFPEYACRSMVQTIVKSAQTMDKD